ncbi:hypothetical protein Fcan01_24125 [Folsomia candida]|uniref:Uncharacterized protein n=1 Tax=Folsomia candida TaxID=158441 RepID=A0A226D892_FOLCA|nr:hypothetical protein Fcan01_24125 [Folsomia candida]
MPKKIHPKVEGIVSALYMEGLTSRVIVQSLKILGHVISKRSVSNIVNNVGMLRKNQAQGLPPPIIKVRKRKVTTAMMRKVKTMASKKNPYQRNLVHVSQDTIRRILHQLALVKRRKYRVHRLLLPLQANSRDYVQVIL